MMPHGNKPLISINHHCNDVKKLSVQCDFLFKIYSDFAG